MGTVETIVVTRAGFPQAQVVAMNQGSAVIVAIFWIQTSPTGVAILLSTNRTDPVTDVHVHLRRQDWCLQFVLRTVASRQAQTTAVADAGFVRRNIFVPRTVGEVGANPVGGRGTFIHFKLCWWVTNGSGLTKPVLRRAWFLGLVLQCTAGRRDGVAHSILCCGVVLAKPLSCVVAGWGQVHTHPVSGGRRSRRFPLSCVVAGWGQVHTHPVSGGRRSRRFPLGGGIAIGQVLALAVVVERFGNRLVLLFVVTNGQGGTNTVGSWSVGNLNVLVGATGSQLTTQSVAVRVCLFGYVLVGPASRAPLTKGIV